MVKIALRYHPAWHDPLHGLILPLPKILALVLKLDPTSVEMVEVSNFSFPRKDGKLFSIALYFAQRPAEVDGLEKLQAELLSRVVDALGEARFELAWTGELEIILPPIFTAP